MLGGLGVSQRPITTGTILSACSGASSLLILLRPLDDAERAAVESLASWRFTSDGYHTH